MSSYEHSSGQVVAESSVWNSDGYRYENDRPDSFSSKRQFVRMHAPLKGKVMFMLCDPDGVKVTGEGVGDCYWLPVDEILEVISQPSPHNKKEDV